MQEDYTFVVCRMERFTQTEDPNYVMEEIARKCQHFNVRWIAADGNGHGNHLNRLLFARLTGRPRLFGIFYANTGQEPRPDGVLAKWTVGRSRSIGTLISRVKSQRLLFPRAEEVGSYFDEFACEMAEYDDDARTLKYRHPEAQPDDLLHGTNYAILLATLQFQGNEGLGYY